jgi:hypothetical protein
MRQSYELQRALGIEARGEDDGKAPVSGSV